MKGSFQRLAHRVVLAAAVTLAGCGGRDKAVKRDLADAGYQLTEADWFRVASDDNSQAMDRFLRGGIAIDCKNPEGDTALHVAATAGALKTARFLLDHKLAVDIAGAGGRTPLMDAVRSGKAEMARWLMRQGANPKAKDADGYTPLMLAVKEGRTEAIGELATVDRDDLDGALLAAALLGKTSVIDELTKYGASVYARMDDGRTALMLAGENGHDDTAKLLIDLGANRFTKDPDGHTASDLAASAGHPELAKFLAKEPSPQELALNSDEQIGREMDTYVEGFTASEKEKDKGGSNRTSDSAGDGSPGSSGGRLVSARRTSAAPVSIDGQSLASEGRPPASERAQPIAESPPVERAVGPGLVMRAYRQRELPIEVNHVEGTTARFQVQTPTPHEVKVAEGEMIPGSKLKVIRVQRRFDTVKDSQKEAEVSVVEVEDTGSGVRRNFIAGRPVHSHDPMALVEDAASGRRFLASPGQNFTGGDGARYRVADVRPNQIVIEAQATGAMTTLPLRGPRG